MEVRATTPQELTDAVGRESFACVSSAWQAHEGELLGYLRHRSWLRSGLGMIGPVMVLASTQLFMGYPHMGR